MALRLLFALLINAIPLYGVEFQGWSGTTVIVLYWFENLLVTVFTCARIALHRQLTRKRGHWRRDVLTGGRSNSGASLHLLGEYSLFAFMFTLAHGVFVGAFVLIARSGEVRDAAWQFSSEQFARGALWMLAAILLEFLFDAATIRSRSFAWIKALAGLGMGRVFVLQLTLIFGMWAMKVMDSPIAMVYALIGFKTLWDLVSSTTRMQATDLPKEPPKWALLLAGKTTDLANDWARKREAMIRTAQEDEQIMAEKARKSGKG